MLLLLLLAAAAGALTPENVAEIQQQQALVAESSLGATMSQCLLHNYCKVGAAPAEMIPADSIAFGLSESYKIVAKVLENNRGRVLPNMQKIKTAFNLGQKTGNAGLCQEVFRCAKTEVNLPTETEVAARKAVPDCGEVGMVCPGLSIGCSLCGAALPALCGTMCPMAGLFCGSSGYFCTLAAAP